MLGTTQGTSFLLVRLVVGQRLRPQLAQRLALERDGVRVVDQSIEDGVGPVVWSRIKRSVLTQVASSLQYRPSPHAPGQFLAEEGQAQVEQAEPLTAGSVAKSAGEVGLTGADGAGDQKVFVIADPVAACSSKAVTMPVRHKSCSLSSVG